MTNETGPLVAKQHWMLRLLGRLPLVMLHGLGAMLGWLVYAASARYRRALREHLAQAGLDTPAIRRQSIGEAGRMLAELPWVWCRSPDAIAVRVRCDDLAVLDAAEAEARGILFVTPHLGGFEVTARFYASRRPITVLFRPPKRAWLARIVSAARTAPGLFAVPVGGAGVRALLRALREGNAVGLLPDQVPAGGQGRWSRFFGRPAYTMTLPARLAEQTGAAVVIAVGERLAGGRGWRLHLERMRLPPTPERLNQRFEVLVRRLPSQYLWAYNRYKQPEGAAPVPRDV